MPKSSVEVRQERTYSPSLDSMLKISLGVSIFAVLSFALVYGAEISVEVDGTSYNVEYTSDAVTLSSPIVDLDIASLRFTVDAPDSAGTLDITFQRSFFDSQRDGLDVEFFVLTDSEDVSTTVTESDTSTTRSLSIEIPAGTEEVEILGSVIAGTDLNSSGTVDEPEPPVPDPAPDPAPTPDPVPDPVPAPTPDPDPVSDTPDTQCGVGTKLQDGQCVLDDTCGPGTVLVGGQCIIDQSAIPSTKSLGKDLGVGFFAAFAAAGIIGVFLGIVAKASRSGN